jgi:hypothetical protein
LENIMEVHRCGPNKLDKFSLSGYNISTVPKIPLHVSMPRNWDKGRHKCEKRISAQHPNTAESTRCRMREDCKCRAAKDVKESGCVLRVTEKKQEYYQ